MRIQACRNALAETISASEEDLNDFCSVFFAPGVAHCSGGLGPFSLDPIQALVDRGEYDKPPETLFANITLPLGVSVDRHLCRYPRVLKYDGIGDVNSVACFSCV